MKSKKKPPTPARPKKHNFSNIDTSQVVQNQEAEAADHIANQSVRTGHSRSSRAEKRSRKQQRVVIEQILLEIIDE